MNCRKLETGMTENVVMQIMGEPSSKRKFYSANENEKKPAQALEAYQLDLERHPNRFNGIYGAAVAAKNLDEHEMATMYFEELLKLAEGVDSDRAELEEARELVGQRKVK